MSRLSVIAAAVAVCACAPAFAATSASATLGPLQLQLFDLDPLDGITPSVVFNLQPFGYGAQTSATAAERFANNNYNAYSPQGWGTVSANADTPRVHAQASMSGATGGRPAGASLAASGSVASFTGADPYESASFSAMAAGPDYSGSFQLSANTLLVLKGSATVSGTAEAPPASSFFGNQFQAFASMSVSGPAPSGGGTQYANDGIDLFAFAFPGGSDVIDSKSRNLAVSFTNLTGDWLTGTLQTNVSVSGYQYANPVPEPRTYALLAAGLAAVGFMVRRRRD